jgi:hypothetical protein
LLSKEEWEGALAGAGFEVVLSKKVVSSHVTRWWDLFLLTAWPYRLLHPLGIAAVWHPRWFRTLVKKQFKRLLEEEPGEGSNLLFLAKKPAAGPGAGPASPAEAARPGRARPPRLVQR